MARRGGSGRGRGRVDWRGDEVKRNVNRAAAKAVDETMGKCVVRAKQKVRVKTATLQGSIRFDPAVVYSRGVRGTWGSFDVNYALWQEIGTSRMSAQPYLRPAADAEYPQLADRIRDNLRGYL